MNKYRNTPCVVNGEKYRSQNEYARHMLLKEWERLGYITELKREVPYVLAPAVKLGQRKKPALRYVADFVFRMDTVLHVQDVKGFDKKTGKFRMTPEFRIKQHLMMSVHGIEVELVK